MSDPMTNIEIEDVLTSIRRLVAEGDKLRPTAPVAVESTVALDNERSLHPAPEPLTERKSDTSPLPPRLVLTPAFRVDDAPLVLGPEKGDADNAKPAGAPVENPANDPSDTSSGFATGRPQAANPADDVHGRSRLEATIAELEAAITVGTDDWEPDGSEDMPVVDWSAQRSEGLFTTARTLGHEGVQDAEVIKSTDLPAPPKDEPEVIALELAQVDETDDLADDLQRSDGGSYDAELDEDLAAYLQEDQFLDEETLRNLVIEIVRQELQGTLGERITRNVRKLVRKEIYRVLASQDFD